MSKLQVRREADNETASEPAALVFSVCLPCSHSLSVDSSLPLPPLHRAPRRWLATIDRHSCEHTAQQHTQQTQEAAERKRSSSKNERRAFEWSTRFAHLWAVSALLCLVLQAAGVSRRDRYKGAQASTRQITKRDSHGLNSSRRESGALPFDGDSAPGAPADESFDADDAEEGGDAEADQSFDGGDDDGADEAETTLDSTSTPRSTRRSPARSAAKHSPAASPAAAASSSSAAAAAAAPASTRSTRHSVAASPVAAKSGRKSSAAAAAAASPFSPAAASASPAAASSPSVSGSPSLSPVMAGGRARTKRADELRMSTSFALPFSRGPSRAPSMAPSHAGGGADEDEEDEEDAGQRYALPEDVSFVAGDDGYGDDEQADADEPMEERKSSGKKKRPSSAGGAPAAAAAASSSSSSAAAAAAAPSKRAAPAPKRPRAEAGAGVGGKGKGVGRKTMQLIATGRMYDGLGDIGEEKEGFASDAEGSPAVNKRPKRTHIPPTAWWEMKEVNYLIDERGRDGTLSHIDPENPIKVLVKSVETKERVRPKPHKKHSSSSAAAAAAGAPKPKEREVKNKPIPTNMQIVDATGAEITVPAVAKHADHIPLESLGGAGVDPKSLPFPLPHGGKAFEQPEFSSGLLMLPPRAKKQLEEANNNEVFYVIEGPANMLQVTVHHTVLHLSKASQFMIPTGNRYSMQNLSHTDSITIFFVLVKPAQTWMNEWHEQHKAQQEEIERAAAAAQEEEEEEEEEEVPAPRKKAQGKRK